MPTNAKQAEYEVLIPRSDNLGNPLKDLGKYAHDYMNQAVVLSKAHIDTGRRVFWEGREEPFDALIFIAQDEPKTDSTVKQLAAFLGEVANQDLVLVSKNGKQGVQAWPIKNNKYVPGQAADSSVLLQNANSPH